MDRSILLCNLPHSSTPSVQIELRAYEPSLQSLQPRDHLHKIEWTGKFPAASVRRTLRFSISLKRRCVKACFLVVVLLVTWSWCIDWEGELEEVLVCIVGYNYRSESMSWVERGELPIRELPSSYILAVLVMLDVLDTLDESSWSSSSGNLSWQWFILAPPYPGHIFHGQMLTSSLVLTALAFLPGS